MDRKGKGERLNAAERHPYVDELLRSPIGVLVIARSIVEVGGSPPDMQFANSLGAASSASDIAYCLQVLASREAGDGYFDLLTERVSWGKLGAQTHLFGWQVESTAWLQWVFDCVERLPDVDPGVDWDVSRVSLQ